ncbi:hypothetical protein C2G38_2171015 [Gigaspora rosea]|uniref:Uncharacterized protein n=1 Tax=Gigaspora rosea TaxID=44941 RepID=A0A397VR80_9GLOM|nr:hypothetical protein C2G38_2171015 [Gigaspora rosea]
MSETDLKSTSHLLRTMRYPYGKNKDQIILLYIQNKAIQYVYNSLYKPGKSLETLNNENKQLKKENKKLQQSKNRATHKVRQLSGSIVQFKCKHRHHISRIRAVAKCPPELKDNDLMTVPKSYILKCELFQNWLNDFELNIEVQCLVKFGQEFYRLFAEFLVGYDPQLKVLQPDHSLQYLPLGRRAHQMPDFIISSTYKLVNIAENLYSFYGGELLQSTEILDYSEIELLVQKLEMEYRKGLNYTKNVLKKPWPKFPTLKELSYVRFLEMDLKQKRFDDFGLKTALAKKSFFQEFSAFVRESNVQLHQYPQLYDFVKNKIWYIIVHQQQVEGLFNKWDIKTHPKMTNNTQQSRMRLSAIGMCTVQS